MQGPRKGLTKETVQERNQHAFLVQKLDLFQTLERNDSEHSLPVGIQTEEFSDGLRRARQVRRIHMAKHRGYVALHQRVPFSDLLCLLDEVCLTAPRLIRPGKLDDQVVSSPDLFGIICACACVLIGLPPGSSRACGATGEVDSTVQEIIIREDLDRTGIPKGGFENPLVTGVPLPVDRRPFELGEKAPPAEIESLDDEKDQEEVR